MKPIELIKDETYPLMYRIKYDDGVVSDEMYNLTRAKDILKNYKSYAQAMSTAERMRIAASCTVVGASLMRLNLKEPG